MKTTLLMTAFLLVQATRAHGQALDSTPAKAPAPAIDATKLTKVPKQLTFVEADYPKEAVAKGIEADVVLLLDISAEGRVQGASVLEPTKETGYGFDEAATEAAMQFTFEPAELDGKPIAVQLSYKYKFRLKPKEVPPPAPAQTAPNAPPAPPPPKAIPIANFTGRLLERGTRAPMIGTLVTIFRETPTGPVGFDATTDKDGHFTFFDLTPGEWKILVEAPGYYPYRTTEEVRPGEATDVKYYVERGTYNPFDVTVTAQRPRKEVNRVVLPSTIIDKIPGASGDPLAVVQNFAGVARVPFGSGQIMVRGSAPEDSKVFIDSVEVPNVYHFGGLRSVVPVGILDSIEFQPGNFATYYGRATGGIVDVQIKQLKPKRASGYADVSILDTGLYLEAPVTEKFAFALAARRSYLDAILNATVPSDAPVSLVQAPVYYDYQALVNYRPSAAHDIRAFFFGADDRLELLFKNPADLSTETTSNRFTGHTNFYRGLLTYKYVPTETFENTLRASYGDDLSDFKIGKLLFQLTVHSWQLRDTVRWKLGEHLALVTGFDGLVGQADGLIRLPLPPKEGEPDQMGMGIDLGKTLETRFDNVFWSPAGFADLELKPIDKMLISAGVRVDHFTRIHQTTVDPRMTFRYELPIPFTLKGGVGLFHEEPFFDETDPAFGNPALKAEYAIHYSVGGEWKPRPFITVDGTLFYKDLHNQVSPTDATTIVDGQPKPLLYDNNGKGRVMGAELVLRHDFTTKFVGWLAYTLSRAERLDSGKTDYRLFDYDQTHILTAVVSYKLPRNWQVGSRYRLVSGNPRTPVVASVFDSIRDQYMPVYGQVNSDRIAPFHQLDIRIDKRWIYDAWTLNFYVDLQNAYNRANPEGTTYNYDFSLSKATQGLPILTILGIRAEF